MVCSNCDKDCTRHRWMCDRVDGAWCTVCFAWTACGVGDHGEGCPTQVFSDETPE
jgi:hypothetical protein